MIKEKENHDIFSSIYLPFITSWNCNSLITINFGEITQLIKHECKKLRAGRIITFCVDLVVTNRLLNSVFNFQRGDAS